MQLPLATVINFVPIPQQHQMIEFAYFVFRPRPGIFKFHEPSSAIIFTFSSVLQVVPSTSRKAEGTAFKLIEQHTEIE